MSNFIKICPVEAEFFHVGAHDEANSRFFAIFRKRLKYMCIFKQIKIQVGKPRGKNGAGFRGNEIGGIRNRNITGNEKQKHYGE
jgi:hypothetical protein